MRSSAEIALGPGLISRRLRASDSDVVWLRSVLEGYEGLGHLHGDGTGIVSIVAPEGRAAELDDLLEELAQEAPIHLLST